MAIPSTTNPLAEMNVAASSAIATYRDASPRVAEEAWPAASGAN
jgi:hypothetical protein